MRSAIVGVVLGTLGTGLASADFAVFQGDGSSWFQSVQSWSTITFAEFPANTPIAEQYAPLGVHFTDTDGNWIDLHSTNTYPQDGFGLLGWVSVQMSFDEEMTSLAAHFPGQARFDFYLGASLLYSSTMMGGGGYDFFAGFTSTTGFDRVRIYGNPPDPFGNPDPVFFDNFYFSNVPVPSAALPIALVAPMLRMRRRRVR